MASLSIYEKIPSNDWERSSDSSCRHEGDLLLDSEGQMILSRPISLWSRFCSQRWKVSTLFFLITTTVLSYQNWRLQRMGSYSTGWTTDLRPVTEALEIVQKSFTGGLILDDELNLIRVQEPGVTQYVGTPTPQIDKAWDDLMIASEIKLEGEQAKPWRGLTIDEENGSVRIEIEVYHTLHCVNEVRKAIDYDFYYSGKQMPYWWRGHVDHCLDYIRQTVLCHADISPLTFLPEERLNGTDLPVFGAVHTCRNFDKIHEWAMERHDPFSSSHPPSG